MYWYCSEKIDVDHSWDLKGWIVQLAFYGTGSEIAGEVIETGDKVKMLSKVIAFWLLMKRPADRRTDKLLVARP